MVSAVKSQDLADLAGHLCYPGGVSKLVLTSGGFRVEPRGGRRPPPRMVVMLGRAWFFLLHLVRAVPHGGTAGMACATEKVANIIGESMRVGVRLRLCGQGLHSCSSWSGTEVDGVVFVALHTGAGWVEPCPQGYGPPPPAAPLSLTPSSPLPPTPTHPHTHHQQASLFERLHTSGDLGFSLCARP